MSRKLSRLRHLPKQVVFNNICDNENAVEQRLRIETCRCIIERDSRCTISDTELERVVDQFYTLGEVAIGLFLQEVAGGRSPSGKE